MRAKTFEPQCLLRFVFAISLSLQLSEHAHCRTSLYVVVLLCSWSTLACTALRAQIREGGAMGGASCCCALLAFFLACVMLVTGLRSDMCCKAFVVADGAGLFSVHVASADAVASCA